MRKKLHMIKRCRALAMAGLIGAGILMPAGTALAGGPGDSLSIVTNSGPGGPGSFGGQGGPGSSGDQGGPGDQGDSGNQGGPGGQGNPGQAGSGAADTARQANPNAWKKVNGVYQMPDGTAIRDVLFRGIDVSRWQGDIDWNQVAGDDVSFVMLGTRSKGAVDPYFHQNIQKASAAGVRVGVYIYSLATTPQMAMDEADFVLDLIHDYPISYPVAFDMEDSTQGALSKDELSQIANAFCSRISQAGYYPIIYANDNWLANKLDMSGINYPVWVARYSARPVYPDPVMWQATSTGSVGGIGGNVDIDFQFKDFVPVIPANTWRTVQGNTYYYQNYVKQKNAWIDDGSGWFYMNGDGLVSRGWLTLSGTSYYLDDSTGHMVTGWKQDDQKWYYFGSSGSLSKGWINDGGTWYYSDKQGVMQTGWLEEGGRKYFLDNSGAMKTGWLNQNGTWYYLDPSGILLKGWINDNGTWYYSDSKGAMRTGWLEEGGSKYFLKGSGAMATGWREMDGAWYYFDDSGHMAKGMIDVSGLHYYMDPSTGRMAANTEVKTDGSNYRANENGVLSQIQENAGSTPESQAGGAPDGSGSAPGAQTGTLNGQGGSGPGVQSGSTPGGQGGSAPGVQSGSAPGVQSGSAPGGQGGGAPDNQGGSGQSQANGSLSGPGVVITYVASSR